MAGVGDNARKLKAAGSRSSKLLRRILKAAVRQSGLKRSGIFITTNIRSSARSVKNIPEASGEWICLICAAVLDSYVQRRSKSRKEMYQALLENGKTRSIGVRNWGIGHTEEPV